MMSMAITTTPDIEELTLARDVLQEQIDARVATRDAQKAWANGAVGKGVAG